MPKGPRLLGPTERRVAPCSGTPAPPAFQAGIADDNANRPAIDLPDLVDYDSWFNTDFGGVSSTTVHPGDSWSVTSIPRNNGTATAGSFDVSFYLSTSPYSFDYYLGQTTISSLAP